MVYNIIPLLGLRLPLVESIKFLQIILIVIPITSQCTYLKFLLYIFVTLSFVICFFLLFVHILYKEGRFGPLLTPR